MTKGVTVGRDPEMVEMRRSNAGGQKVDGAVVVEEELTLRRLEPKASNGAAGNCMKGSCPKGLTVAPACWKAKLLAAEGIATWPARQGGIGKNESKSGTPLPAQTGWEL